METKDRWAEFWETNHELFKQIGYYLLISFLPLIINIVRLIWKEEEVFNDYNVFAAGIISTCIPIIAFGFPASIRKGELDFRFILNFLSYTFGIAFVIITEMDRFSLSNKVISYLISFSVYVGTLYSLYVQKKKENEEVDVTQSRQEESKKIEKEVFKNEG